MPDDLADLADEFRQRIREERLHAVNARRRMLNMTPLSITIPEPPVPVQRLGWLQRCIAKLRRGKLPRAELR